MFRMYFTLCIVLVFSSVNAQKDEEGYLKSIAKADSLYKLKDYANAATLYNATFNLNNRGKVIDRYNAAICWALAAKPDSAFYQLNRIATLGNFGNYDMLLSNPGFASLKNDKRWDPLAKRVKENEIANSKRISTLDNIGDIKQNDR